MIFVRIVQILLLLLLWALQCTISAGKYAIAKKYLPVSQTLEMVSEFSVSWDRNSTLNQNYRLSLLHQTQNICASATRACLFSWYARAARPSQLHHALIHKIALLAQVFLHLAPKRCSQAYLHLAPITQSHRRFHR